ncbi:MAG TPA: thioesterase family protein [Candidatus Limnocylindrales bacterium]|nr:thioesterase family protein [Candidatus Limnocylindrales bacterium]
MFERTLTAGWGDMDFNSHMRNTAYLDKSADVRMMYFSENGFPMAEFHRLRLGPVILRDELEYYREVGLLEEVRVTLEIAELSADGSRFLIQNTFYRGDGKLVARVRSKGGWLDLIARKLVAPPEKLLLALQNSPHSDDFKEVPSSLKDGKS